VDCDGTILASVGDPQTRAYIRSSAKPIQALPVLAGGAAEAFGLDDADIAIICGSHHGGEAQIAQVRAVLAKCGLDESALQSGSGIADNCSGKHSGMLAACKHAGFSLEDYTAPDHPHQRRILETLKAVCRLSDSEIVVGVDGCSAPIHYFPIFNMALGYARLAGDSLGQPFDAAARRILRAMWDHPGGHTGEPDYRELLGEAPRLLTKGGGYGVYCAGVAGRGIGFAMKVADGAAIPLKPVFSEMMRRLGVFSAEEASAIRERLWPRVDNRRGQIVGQLQLLI